MTPLNLLSLNMQMTTMLVEAQSVVTLRMLGMGGAIPAPAGENERMIKEKPVAMVDAFSAAAKAVMAGKRPDQIMSAAIAPMGRKVRANRKRLMK
ncbi:MAG: antifreeze protein [Sulfitobacter sp.]